MPSGEVTNTNFIIFGLTWTGLELTIYHTQSELDVVNIRMKQIYQILNLDIYIVHYIFNLRDTKIVLCFIYHAIKIGKQYVTLNQNLITNVNCHPLYASDRIVFNNMLISSEKLFERIVENRTNLCFDYDNDNYSIDIVSIR